MSRKKTKLNNATQSEEELLKTQKESEAQTLPEQKRVSNLFKYKLLGSL